LIRAQDLLRQIEKTGIEVITGVPDSTLKSFCDGLQLYEGNLQHYVTVNEGAAVAAAIGTYLASGKPACVYMQNSGIGNAVNPIASLAHTDVYGIPMLFLVGWRGEPGKKDEPQHVFQGKVTCRMFELLEIEYAVIDENTTDSDIKSILERSREVFYHNRQFAIIIKKNTFAEDKKYVWDNGNTLKREAALKGILEILPKGAVIVSTTGKISRELYEQSNALFGNHESLFMTVGGMGHASMIAFGIAKKRPEKRIICVDGDGAVLMHMGALSFIAEQAPENYVHIVINNMAHESVGAMPTGCRHANFSELAKTAGYVYTERIFDMQGIKSMGEKINKKKGPMLFEIMVDLSSRPDLSRPAETAKENRDHFMRFIGQPDQKQGSD